MERSLKGGLAPGESLTTIWEAAGSHADAGRRRVTPPCRRAPGRGGGEGRSTRRHLDDESTPTTDNASTIAPQRSGSRSTSKACINPARPCRPNQAAWTMARTIHKLADRPTPQVEVRPEATRLLEARLGEVEWSDTVEFIRATLPPDVHHRLVDTIGGGFAVARRTRHKAGQAERLRAEPGIAAGPARASPSNRTVTPPGARRCLEVPGSLEVHQIPFRGHSEALFGRGLRENGNAAKILS